MSDDELHALNAIATHRDYPAGSIIQGSGEPSTFLASIVEGVVKLIHGLPDGREQIVGLLFSADFLGRTFADVYPCHVVAVTDVKICRYPQEAFEEILERFPGLEERLYSDTLKELERAHGWLLLLGRKTAAERLATLLVMLGDRQSLVGCHHLPQNNSLNFDLPLTRTEIADFLGLTIETVSRQFSRLKKDGLIQIANKRHIVVPDRKALEDLAGD